MRVDQRGSSSQTACPGKSAAPGWRWAAPLWTSPCLAAAASAGPRSDPCSPLIQSPPGMPPQPEVVSRDIEWCSVRSTAFRKTQLYTWYSGILMCTGFPFNHLLPIWRQQRFFIFWNLNRRESRKQSKRFQNKILWVSLTPHLSHLLCALLYIGCGLWPRGQLVWLVHVALC